jgi:hypothetical protein
MISQINLAKTVFACSKIRGNEISVLQLVKEIFITDSMSGLRVTWLTWYSGI